MKEQFKSRVYTDRPAYADFEAPAKFEAIKSIIAKRRELDKIDPDQITFDDLF